MPAKQLKLSKRAKRLLDAYAGEVSDHREWNNEHNVKRARAEMERYIARLEAIERRTRSLHPDSRLR